MYSPMYDKDAIELLLTKYITGNADSDETRMVKDWIARGEENARHFQELELSWELSRSFPNENKVQEARNKIHKALLNHPDLNL